MMSKRHNDHLPMNDLLKSFVKDNKLEKGLDNVNVSEAWFSVMGSGVKSYTTEIYFRNETLYVRLSSSVLREELSYGNQKIISLLNEYLKKQLVNKLVLR